MSGPEFRLRFRVQAQSSEVGRLRERLGTFLDRSGPHFDDRSRLELTLALDEAANNIVEHAYSGNGGVIDVEYETHGDDLVIRLWDNGIQRAATDCIGLPEGTAGESGMGTNIMRATFSSLSYERDGERNLLILRRGLDDQSWTGSDA